MNLNDFKTNYSTTKPYRVAKALRDRIRGYVHSLSRADYPSTLAVGNANLETVDFIKKTSCRVIAEIGIFKGYTSELLARYLNNEGELHLFDFQERVDMVAANLRRQGFTNIVIHGNSHKSMDSYAWSLMRLLEIKREPFFDYVFLDGAHTWLPDATAFLTADRLLKAGGYMDFDDYDWSLATSSSLNPAVFPPTRKHYTPEQIEAQHVRLIVDLLVRPTGKYEEIVPNKIFQKVGLLT